MIEPTTRPILREQAAERSRSRLRDRVVETYPAIFSWIVVLAPIWLTLIHPVAGLAFVMFATGVFVLKVGYYGIGALRSRRKVMTASTTDWADRLAAEPDWQDYRVFVMYRAFRENNRAMLEASLQSIVDSHWPDAANRFRQIEVVYATEINDVITPPILESLAEQFAGQLTIRQIPHPVEPDVLPGPSSAMHFAGRVLYDDLVDRGIDPAKVIVADFDSDTVMHPAYLPCLLATFLSDPAHDRRVYQPVVLFTLDYWAAPLHSRIAGLGTSALTLGWNSAPEVAFTGAAASLALLESVDFWPTLSHSQDSGVELRLRMKYGDEFAVQGLPVTNHVYPVMMLSRRDGWRGYLHGYWTSFKVLFRQSARWREGPLDEFLEAVRQGQVYFALLKLWSGIERDTMTILPGWGYLATKAILQLSYPRYDLTRLDTALAVVLSVMTVIGLTVSWQLLSTEAFVSGRRPIWRRAIELGIFYLVMPILLPVITACAGLKTSTTYALGKKPTGAYIPTPK